MQFTPQCPFISFDETEVHTSNDTLFMRCAFNEALKAWNKGEIPIGAIGVINGEIVARAYNRVETEKDATAHAEIEIIRYLAHKKGDWRLSDLTLYVTKEPCPMCSGAIYKSRIPRVVLGAFDPIQGCLGGRIHFNTTLHLYHQVQVDYEPLEGLCEDMIKTFFKLRRKHALDIPKIPRDKQPTAQPKAHSKIQ